MFNLGKFAKLGRNGDNTLAHVRTGERVLPEGILNKDLEQKINNRMQSIGLDPERYIVGSPKNSINPNTQQPEFFDNRWALPTTIPNKKDRLDNFLQEYGQYTDQLSGQISDLEYPTTPTSTVMGTTEGGTATLSPVGEGILAGAQDQMTAWGDLMTNQLNQATDDSDALRQAYEGFGPSSYNTRQDLENLFLGAAGGEANLNTAALNSNLASLIGGSGGGSSTYAGAGALAGANALANQKLRIGAFGGAQDAFNRELGTLQGMLSGAQGLDQGRLNMARAGQEAYNAGVANIFGLGQNQMTQLGMGLGLDDAIAGFDLNKLEGLRQTQSPYIEWMMSQPGRGGGPGTIDKILGYGGQIANIGATLGMCHVARLVFGEENPEWVAFYVWKEDMAPKWFRKFYNTYAKPIAEWLRDKPKLQSVIRNWMRSKIYSGEK